MLKLFRVEKFTIEFQDYEQNKDYNVRIRFIPDGPEANIFGQIYVDILAPHAHGLVDKTVTDENYSCFLLFDDIRTRSSGRREDILAFFVRKLNPAGESINPSEPGKITQVGSDQLGKDYRSLKGPSGNTSVNLGNASIELVAGSNRIVISDSGISVYGEQKEYNLPTKSHGGIFKETGLLRYFPKNFLPPFTLPDFMPDVSFATKVLNMLDIIRKMRG